MSIDYEFYDVIDRLNINSNIVPKYRKLLREYFSNYYCKPNRPELPNVQMEAVLTLKIIHRFSLVREI